VSRGHGRQPGREDLESLWGGPPGYPPPLWMLLRALHRLPWPLGEDVLSAVFVAKAFVRLDHLRRDLAWASGFASGRRRWQLALTALASRGRFVARAALIGMRSADDVRRQFAVRGEELLQAVAGPIILLGFHVGPPYSYVALRATGRPVTLVASRCIPEKWSRLAWGRPERENQDLMLGKDGASRATMLYRAHQVLRQGGMVYMTADTGRSKGREAFRLSIHGRDVVVKPGWLALRRETGATVLPVLAHLDGRTGVVTIHPPLPPPGPDLASDSAACRESLERLLVGYARHFPEQCWSVAR
jgi:lauroyl/myristoyl acyltransferase